MAVKVNEKKAMLKTVTTKTNSDGNIKKKSLTIRNIDANASNDFLYDLSKGFRVIIVIEANSYVNIRSSRLLPKFKTQKINSWCAA